ncbi:MAG TPA: PTS sugar transporter subunit IIC [Longimicrobiaceae bacterium]|nr:PTS sugar transporter subunit IIC [Longimicrobiaceae bacterium]
MNPGPGTLAAASLVGGVAALDATSLGQVMLSRPIVAATLGGVLAGDPVRGALLGAVLEALHLGVLPVGASRYPEGGPPAVAGGVAFAVSTGSWMALLVTVVCCMLWEWVSGATVQRLRQMNVRIAVPAADEEIDVASIERRHLRAMAMDFGRGVALTLVAMLLLMGILRLLPSFDGSDERVARLALAAVAAAGIAAALRLFGTRRWPLFLAGAAGGAALLWLR